MKKIALYGYGAFGKTASESFRFWWGGEYEVTAVFDRDLAGEADRFWNLRILSPDAVKEEYSQGTFEAVMVCILAQKIRQPIEEMLTDLGIPLFLPGSVEDFADPESFPQEEDAEISVSRDKYSFHIYKNMLGAVGGSARPEMLFLFDENGRLNAENYKKQLEEFKHSLLSYPFRLRDPLPEKVYMDGSWCALTKPYSGNYWHFTFDMADSVYLMEAAGYKGKYIFRDKPFARELLQIMGVSPDRLVSTEELDCRKVYVFERLYQLGLTRPRELEYSMEVLHEMAEFVKARLKRDESSPKKIYVKRVGIRKLLNGDDIAEKNGFTVIIPEQYSVREQIELFYNADIVICPHGANVTNCLYMRKDAVLAEIFSDRWHTVINADICRTNGVHYLQIVGKACKSGPMDMYEDYTVGKDEFQRLIEDAEEIAGGNMKKIALYGYGNFGRRMAESFRYWWGDKYIVTAIFDEDQAGDKDRFWNLTISDTGKIKDEYTRGTFEAIMICIYNPTIRWKVEEKITDLGVPLFLPGSTENFAAPEYFSQDTETGINICREHYVLHVYKNMFGAVGINAKLQIIYLFDKNGRLCIDNVQKYLTGCQPFLLSYPFRLRDPLPEKVFMEGSWCFLIKPYSLNYWHFTFETADNAYLLEKAGYKGKYILKDDRSARELLEIMGISPDRVVSMDVMEPNKVYVFERLFTVNQVGMGYMECPTNVLPEMAEFFRKKLKRDENRPKRIYVKRIGIRKLLNGDELALKNGLTIVVPEGHTVMEEMEIFYNADIVITPHGANSTNYLYMRKGTVFVEIFSDRWDIDINTKVCEANGVHYMRLVGKACESGPMDMYADYTVDEQTFQRAVREAEAFLLENGTAETA